MKGKLTGIAVMSSLLVISVASMGMAAEKRCTAAGKKVECPTKTAKQVKAAAANYEKEANDMIAGKGGSTYGIAPFDALTGIGKQTKLTDNAMKAPQGVKELMTKGVESGYTKGTGKTEVWGRRDAAKKGNKTTGDELYNQWTNNWSPSFSKSLVPGANPNEGKQWYYVYCVGCHGWTLEGDGPNAVYLDPLPRDLTAGKRYMNKKTNVELFTIIKGGGGAVDLSDVMPSWGNLLMDQDIWNVVAWIRANADRQAIKSLGDYLGPKSSFNPKSKANKVNPLNAADDDDFADAQELMEATLAGRGVIKGAGFVEGGLRKAPEAEMK